MDQRRDIQNFKRNERTRVTVSSCSSLGMEIKRKKIKESTVILQQEDCDLQEKIDFEIRMREGAYKLLVASTQRDQVLSASKNLLTCNARIEAYMAELQKKGEVHILINAARRSSDGVPKDRIACKGKVAISGLRIPLMWKDTDHFNNRGSSRRVAVFCLMKMGAEVFDTDMVIVDRSVTDICFDGLTIFKEASPDFELKLEVYSCAMEEETSLVNTPKKLAKKLGSSLSKSTGKKHCPLQEGGDPESFFQSSLQALGAKYSLLAHTTLGLAQAEEGFQSHTLTVPPNEDSSFWLPLYGNVCCRLVAQPECMTQDMMSGFLNQQQNIVGVPRCSRLFCVLRAGQLLCYYTPEEIEAKLDPAIVIPINKETRIRAIDKDSKKRSHSFTIINPRAGEAVTNVFVAECKEELQKWMEGFWQHFYDLSQWKHCCSDLMKIEVVSPRRPPLFLTKQATSVYHDLSIDSPTKLESLTDLIHHKIEETGGRFLIGQEEDPVAPRWASLFEGSHPMVVQKCVLSPARGSETPSPGAAAAKKRRAPPPPPAKAVALGPAASHALPREEAGSWRRPAVRAGRPSLDSKLSAVIQQLQRPSVPSRKKPPRHQEGTGAENRPPELPARPVPAPRPRLSSLKEKMKPKPRIPALDGVAS
uniref:Rhotekin 2 n=1 Tax=Lepisosteus oculatus TaxID=7918 RepID=W5MIN7_LEPOC|nr:PREDICTED: rhotekin-2 [Lepisosteus oculatus]